MPNSRLSRDAREDARLVRECLGGDDGAFEALVLKYQDQVFNVACRMVGDSEAMDVAQEAFIKAYQGLETYKPGMPFRAWLLRIGTNAAIDSLRRRSRGRDVPSEMMVSAGNGADGTTAAAFDPPGPDTRRNSDARPTGPPPGAAALARLAPQGRHTFHCRPRPQGRSAPPQPAHGL